MALSFTGNLDRDALLRASGAVVDLVSAPVVSSAWDDESALAGMTVGGLTRHLVSQPECAVEFLSTEAVPAHAPILSLVQCYQLTDWFRAPVTAVENTSIRDDFNAMAAGGPEESMAILEQSRANLPGALDAAGPTTYVPWQDCALSTDDFLAIRLMEVVVHADDLAASVGLATPAFDDDVLHPALALLAVLSALRHGQIAALRALARQERAIRPAAAF